MPSQISFVAGRSWQRCPPQGKSRSGVTPGGATVAYYLLYDTRTEIAVIGGGHDEDRVDFRAESPVNLRLLKFILEVGHRPQAFDDGAGPVRQRILYQESAKSVYHDARHVTADHVQKPLSLIGVEHCLL